MKILVVSQYFWPENFRINDLCLSLSERGHEVTVLTGCPNYPEGRVFDDFKANPDDYSSVGNIEIIRAPMFPRNNGPIFLLLNYVSFFISASILGLWKLRGRKFDVVFSCQLSPVTAVIPAIVIKRNKKIPLIMWSLDLWPDSLRAVGQVKSEWVLSLVGWVVSKIYSNCDLILGQSDSYLEAINKRNKNNIKLALFPNWAEDLFGEIPVKSNDSIFTILFAGNIGESQDLGVLLNSAVLLKNRNISVLFSIVGDGRMKKWLEAEVIKLELMEYFAFHGQHPIDAMPSFYSSADVALVSLKNDDIFARTIPGKVQSYMMAGLPILSVLNGEGSKLIDEAGCGLSCGSGDHEKLADNIETMLGMAHTDIRGLGLKGQSYAKINFSKEKLLSDIEGYCNEVIDHNFLGKFNE